MYLFTAQPYAAEGAEPVEVLVRFPVLFSEQLQTPQKSPFLAQGARGASGAALVTCDGAGSGERRDTGRSSGERLGNVLPSALALNMSGSCKRGKSRNLKERQCYTAGGEMACARKNEGFGVSQLSGWSPVFAELCAVALTPLLHPRCYIFSLLTGSKRVPNSANCCGSVNETPCNCKVGRNLLL